MRRSRMDVIYDILEVINLNPKIVPTQIMYKSNLSYSMMKNYLELLISKELVVVHKVTFKKKDLTRYEVTRKGYLFIEKHLKLKNLENEFGL